MSSKDRARKEFKVRIDVELPQEALDRIERAIQKAVLNAVAEIDVADGYSVLMHAPSNGGDRETTAASAVLPPPLDGIWIRPETS